MTSLIESLEPRRLLASGTPTFTVRFDDNGGFYSGWYDRVRSTLLAAANDWAQHIDSDASIEIEVDFDPFLTRPTLATAGYDERVFFRRETGYDVYQGNVAAELRTGVDANGSESDAEISIRPGALDEFYYDSSAGRTGTVPGNRIDARSVLLHELGHVLGIFGDGDGPFDSPSGGRTVYDQYVELDGEDLYFAGPNAMAAYGGERVPLAFDDSSHVGNDYGPGEDLADDLMAQTIPDGARRLISPVDLGLIADGGVPLKSSLAPFVTAPSSASAVRGVDPAVDFVVTLSKASDQPVTVPVWTFNGSAVAGRDYAPVDTVVTFAPGETRKTVSVPVLTGVAYDRDRSFTLNFGEPAGASMLVGQATGVVRAGELTVDARHRGSFVDPDGGTVTVSLKGPGLATVTRDEAGRLQSIALTNSNASTTLSIRSSRPVTLHGLTAPAGLGGINAPHTNFDGTLGLVGVSTARFLDVAPGSSMTFGSAPRPLTFAARNLTDASVTLAGTAKSVSVLNWLDTGGTADALSAAGITKMTVKGELSADVLSSGPIGTLSVGTLRDARVRANGNVGTVTLGAAFGSELLVGTDTWADSADDFANPSLVLRSLTVRGAGLFSDTRLSAPVIQTAKLGVIQADNQDEPFGVSARSVASISGSTPLEPRFRRAQLTTPQTVQENDFVVQIV